MRRNINRLYIWILAGLLPLLLQSCEDPYNPKAITAPNNYLVVEGMLNGGDITRIRLTRTRNLNQGNVVLPVVNASVSVESSTSNNYTFTEEGKGWYTTYVSALNANEKYRLRIRLNTGKEYVSDFVEVKNSPPIDTVRWEVKDAGIRIFVNTHDPLGKSQYYHWEFEETWQYHAAFSSMLIWDYSIDTLRQRTPGEMMFECWRTVPSSAINVNTSVNLGEDIISNDVLTDVPVSSGKLTNGYSILVKQYALDARGYDYWLNMKKVSESMGSLFDAQPSQFKGNIQCTQDSKEIVVGYFSAGNAAEKRIYVTPQMLPYLGYYNPDPDCLITEKTNPDSAYVSQFGISNMVPLYFESTPTMLILTSASPSCSDCRLKGGSTTPPSWWNPPK